MKSMMSMSCMKNMDSINIMNSMNSTNSTITIPVNDNKVINHVDVLYDVSMKNRPLPESVNDHLCHAAR